MIDRKIEPVLEAEVRGAPAVDESRADAARDQLVHRERRREPEHGRARPGECLHQLLQHLVGPVRRPHLVRAQAVAEECGEVATQRRRLAVRVAVELAGHPLGGGGDVGDQRRGQRERVLVGVQRRLDVELRSAVRRRAAQIRAQRQIRELDAGRAVSHATA